MQDLPVPRTLRAVVEYDGSPFAGWERQKNGLAIQELIEEAIRAITGASVVVEGSGRTDAGVHAAGQVASFVLGKDIAPDKLRRALNAVLPPEIAIQSLEEAEPSFHARKSARSKVYQYRILNSRSRRPLERHRSHQVPVPLDATAMHEAAQSFVGTHDFSSFAREADRKKSCVRTVLAVEVLRCGDLITITVEGTGFLYNMVRIIAGTLIDVGLKKRASEDLSSLIDAKSRIAAGATAPARGLTLVLVRY